CSAGDSSLSTRLF
nr:immunoglobulin light chain junction region [Macaca mulatta]